MSPPEMLAVSRFQIACQQKAAEVPGILHEPCACRMQSAIGTVRKVPFMRPFH